MFKTKDLIVAVLIFVVIIYISTGKNLKTEKINLGKSVNTACDEIIPIISANDSILYFTRGECEGNIGGQDIWVSYRNKDGSWQKAINVGTPLNNIYNNFLISLTPDGNRALLGNRYGKDGYPEKGVSISQKTPDGWSFPEPIEIDDYYNLSDQAGFFLANDASTLLMTVKREDSKGDKDIYVSFKKDNGKWSVPKNLGNIVNSEGEEATPFLASDGQTLYFSSNGHGGFGSADIFICRRLDDSWTNWTNPENMGMEINTPNWDAYYKLTGSGEFAYFVSTENSLGKGDIFRMQVPEHLRPKPVMLVSGRVTNAKTFVPISAEIEYSRLPDGTLVGTALSDPISGEYKITLPGGFKYVYKATSRGFFYTSEAIDLKLLNRFDQVTLDLELIPLSDSIALLKNIFFEKNSYTLTPESQLEVNYVSEFLIDYPEYDLQIFGHTDDSGPEDLNLKISQLRAEAAGKFISNNGISNSRISTLGKGEVEPVTTNLTEEGRALNRRCEFYIRKRR